MYEGQVVYKPSLYSEDKYKKQDKLLIEIKIKNNKENIHLFYIDEDNLKIIDDNKLKYVDREAGVEFVEDENTIINLYDTYDIEHISTDYNVYKTDAVVLAISRYIIRANREYIPVIKMIKRRKYKDKLNYLYYTVT